MRTPGKVLQQTLVMLLVGAASCMVGCQTTNPSHPNHGMEQLPPVYKSMPRELSKVVLPEYVIEPPDILNIEGVHIVPKSPYELRTLDVLNITVDGTLPESPIEGPYTVEPGGIINLGPPIRNDQSCRHGRRGRARRDHRSLEG